MEKYAFNNAGALIYNFIWNYFCDYYIEIAKLTIKEETTKSVLCYILTNILKVLHPFMPYVTEEIYQMLPIKDAESIMIAEYPKVSKKNNYETETEIVDDQIEFVKNFRNIKAENNITKDFKILFETKDDNNLITRLLKLTDNIIDKPLDIKTYKVISKNTKATIYFEKQETEEEKSFLQTKTT